MLHNLGGGDGFSLVDEASGDWAYLAVFLLVVGDAICPVFPGETTLNAASTLASQGVLDLGLVMLMGALGAVVGDSALYWIARLCGQRFQPRVQAAKENPKVSAALEFLGSRAPVLLVAGRFVPGRALRRQRHPGPVPATATPRSCCGRRSGEPSGPSTPAASPTSSAPRSPASRSPR